MARRPEADTERRLLDATRRLLAEVGYDALTMERVAQLAGVGKPALYRRFPSRAHLVFAATVDASTGGPEPPDLGNLRSDLLATVQMLVAALTQTPRTVAAEQFAASIRDEDFARQAIARTHGPALAAMLGMWDRAVTRGEVDARIDGRGRLIDLASILVLRTLYFHEPPDDAEQAAIVDHFLSGVRPRP